MRSILLAGLVCTLPWIGEADWTAWRGPDGNGVSTAENVPVEWSATENVLWKVPMPNGSGATPIVYGDAIFLPGVKDGNNIAFSLGMDGEPRWETKLGSAAEPRHRQKGSGSHPSPVTDGTYIYFYFRSGELACLDMEGEKLWSKNLREEYGQDTLYFDLGSSPVLSKDYVIIASMMDPPSYVVAFEKASGEVTWKVDRNLPAPSESHQSYTTPILHEREGVEELYVLGSDHVTAHKVENGEEIWRVGGLNPRQAGNFRAISSPVLEGDILVAPYARGRTWTAIRLGGEGDVTKSHVLWTAERFGADVPSPAALDGKIYGVTDQGGLSCVDVKTGEAVWSGSFDRGTVSASPAIADGKIYVTNEQGTTFVAELGDTFNPIASNVLGEYTLASPVPLDGKILIRTGQNLYCIGK